METTVLETSLEEEHKRMRALGDFNLATTPPLIKDLRYEAHEGFDMVR